MLVLSRKPDEEIVIGDGPNAIVVTVVDIRGGRVRLGITAPQELDIVRGEFVEDDEDAA